MKRKSECYSAFVTSVYARKCVRGEITSEEYFSAIRREAEREVKRLLK